MVIKKKHLICIWKHWRNYWPKAVELIIHRMFAIFPHVRSRPIPTCRFPLYMGEATLFRQLTLHRPMDGTALGEVTVCLRSSQSEIFKATKITGREDTKQERLTVSKGLVIGYISATEEFKNAIRCRACGDRKCLHRRKTISIHVYS